MHPNLLREIRESALADAVETISEEQVEAWYYDMNARLYVVKHEHDLKEWLTSWWEQVELFADDVPSRPRDEHHHEYRHAFQKYLAIGVKVIRDGYEDLPRYDDGTVEDYADDELMQKAIDTMKEAK